MAELKPGQGSNNFEVLQTSDLPEFHSVGIMARHRGTGCKVFHLQNEDAENLFAFAFPTIPRDSTGIAHILEHSVLCGSTRYPTKDPFVSLLQGSMNTFMNAFTFPDKTVYPASSTVEKDLFNLMAVYGDAVFRPLLRREVFRQEGHRLEFDETGRPGLVGVVFNEMKGSYASETSIVAEWAYRSLFPDTPYAFDSGGEPWEIPSLDYETFRAFHQTYYHPANCLVFLYGNIPTEKYLAFLDSEFLAAFSRIDVMPEVPLQPRWQEPRRVEKTYPVAEGQSLQGRTSLLMSWLTVPATEPEGVIAMEVLNEVLLGNSGSPLQKALVESGLGEDVSPVSGLETELREIVFTAGIRGSDPEKLADLERLVSSTLTDLLSQGIPAEVLTGAMRRIEFRNREIRRGGGPHALRLMRRALRGWVHGAVPEATLEFARHMDALKRKVHGEPRYFEQLLERRILQNPHHAAVVVRPDPEFQRRLNDQLDTITGRIVATLGPDGRTNVDEENERLRLFQDTPDSPEDVAKIPSLSKEDVPRDVERIPSEQTTLPNGTVAYHRELFTNGVAYVDLAFNTRGLEPELSRMLPLFAKVVPEAGLPGMPYDEVARQLSLAVGGFGASLEAGTVAGHTPSAPGFGQYLFFRIKALETSLPDAVELATRLITEADFTDLHRIRDLVLELRNDAKSSIVPAGHRYAALRAQRVFSDALAQEERWRGISQLQHLSRIATREDEGLARIAEQLSQLRSELVRQGRLTVNITGSRSAVRRGLDLLSSTAQGLPAEPPTVHAAEPLDVRAVTRPVEGVPIPAAVGYVAVAFPGGRFGTSDHAHETVLSHMLTTGFLWERVRMRGGAYGVFASTSGTEGVFSFSSYRDPRVSETIAAYREALEMVAKGNATDAEVERAVIGTVGRDSRPHAPGEKGMLAFRRALYGIEDEARQEKRRAIVDTDTASVRMAAERLLTGFQQRATAVLAARSALDGSGLEDVRYVDLPV
jgi:hypothetical protein